MRPAVQSLHPPTQPRRRKALLVGESLTAQIALARYLRQQRYSVLTVRSGQRAIAIARRCDLELVLSDDQLSDMAGIDCLTEIHRFCPRATSVLAVDHVDAPTEGQRGCGLVVRKPIDLRQLQAVLSKARGCFPLIERNRAHVGVESIREQLLRSPDNIFRVPSVIDYVERGPYLPGLETSAGAYMFVPRAPANAGRKALNSRFNRSGWFSSRPRRSSSEMLNT